MILSRPTKTAYYFVLLLLLVSNQLIASSNKNDTALLANINLMQEMEELFQGSDDFKNNLVKEKWKSNSSVILCQAEMFVIPESKYDYLYGVERPNFVNYYSRIKVKLQDKYAVKQYSEFTMHESFYYEIKIIKSFGLEINIDTEEAIIVSKEVEGSFTDYISYVVNTNQYKKLAIPNLDTGDILDVRMVTKLSTNFQDKNGWNKLQKSLISPLYVRSLNPVNPVHKWSVHFHLDRAISLNFVSNKSNSKLEKKEESKRTNYYSFTENDLESQKPEHWADEGLQGKGVKFIFYKTLKEPKSVLNSIDPKEDIVKLCNEIYYSSMPHEKLYCQFLQGNRKIKNDDEWVEKFLLNYKMYFNIEFIGTREKKFSFLVTMSQALQFKRIKFDYVYGVTDYFGGIDKLVSPFEGILGIRIRNTGRLIFDLDLYDYKDQEFNVLNGRDVLLIKASSKSTVSKSISTIKLPETNHKENVTSIHLKLRFVDSFRVASIDRETRVSGLNKLSVNKHRVSSSDLRNQIKEYYLGSHRTASFKKRFYFENPIIPATMYANPNKEFIKGETERLENMFQFFSKRNIEDNCIKALEDDDFVLKDYSGMTLKSIGNTAEDPELIFSEKYSLKHLIFPIQNGYAFKLGNLIGRQIEIKDTEDTIRQRDIFMNSPKTFEHVITVEIPEGYNVAGIENFNTVVDNQTGSFTSKIEVKGNQLIWTSKKIYKGRFFSKTDWPLVLEFIKAANKTYHSKIIFYK
jgi:hypothetical protein